MKKNFQTSYTLYKYVVGDLINSTRNYRKVPVAELMVKGTITINPTKNILSGERYVVQITEIQDAGNPGTPLLPILSETDLIEKIYDHIDSYAHSLYNGVSLHTM
jgi:hypothetical protein